MELQSDYEQASAAKGLFLRRAFVMLLIVLALGTVLVMQLLQLQVNKHEHYKTRSDENRIRVQTVAPTRGRIYDRHGLLLADNVSSHTVEIIPDQVDDMEQTLAGIGRLIELEDYHLKSFRRDLRRLKRKFLPVALKSRLTDLEVYKLAPHLVHYPGVKLSVALTRSYPMKESAVHTIGYVGRISRRDLESMDAATRERYLGTNYIGKAGVEKSYEETLHGSVGRKQVETDALGRELRVLNYEPPTAGKNLQLTLDMQLQAKAESILDEFNGSIVAIDPQSGDILALVSQPGYDPNLFVHGISHTNYGKIRDNPNRPLYNRSLQGTYPPGSTLKPFLALAGLQHGLARNKVIKHCKGHYMLPNNSRKYYCWKHRGHGSINMVNSITQSCDVYFYDLAKKLDIERMHAYLDQFGFGKRTGVDLIRERPGILPNRAWKYRRYRQSWFPGETVIVGIGQGSMTSTPLQLAIATGGLATHGKLMQPRIVNAVSNTQGKLVSVPPKVRNTVDISKRDMNDIIRSMKDVMTGIRGTARKAGENLSYTMAGKTGTSQVTSLSQERQDRLTNEELAFNLRDHALFVGYAPVKNPRIAVAVIAEHGGSGGKIAAPLARQVTDYYLQDILGLYKPRVVPTIDSATPVAQRSQ